MAQGDDAQIASAARQNVIAQAYHGYLTSRAGHRARAGRRCGGHGDISACSGARYREGATTILDLLEAQVALSEAEAALVQARFATRLALAQIEALLGRRVFEAIQRPHLNR